MAWCLRLILCRFWLVINFLVLFGLDFVVNCVYCEKITREVEPARPKKTNKKCKGTRQ